MYFKEYGVFTVSSHKHNMELDIKLIVQAACGVSNPRFFVFFFFKHQAAGASCKAFGITGKGLN